MRYRFIDRVLSLEKEPKPRIEVAKTFAIGGDEVSGPAGPGQVPSSLMIELLAMTGGRLLFECLDAKRLPLLAKIRHARFHGVGRPGVELRAVSEITGVAEVAAGVSSAETSGSIYDRGEAVVSATLLYLCVMPPGVDLRTLAGLE